MSTGYYRGPDDFYRYYIMSHRHFGDGTYSLLVGGEMEAEQEFSSCLEFHNYI